MFSKLAEFLTITLILCQVSNAFEISVSTEEHASGASDNIEELSIPPLPDISSHKNFNLLASTSNCGIYSIKKRVTNGIKTDLFEFPWMALLSYEEDASANTTTFLCAGTIINNRYILTTANCLKSRNRLLGVRIGEYNLSSDPDCETEGKNYSVCADPVQDIEIEDIIPHQNFSLSHKNYDIGLLRLRTPIQFSRSIWPICLPTINEFQIQNFTNARLIVTGWGTTSNYGSMSDDLLKAEVSVVSQKKCNQDYRRLLNIDHKYLCAGGPEGDTCQGDSGGPLQGAKLVNGDVQYVQYGITAFGKLCGGPVPGVYTRIDYYMDWVLDNIKI